MIIQNESIQFIRLTHRKFISKNLIESNRMNVVIELNFNVCETLLKTQYQFKIQL